MKVKAKGCIYQKFLNQTYVCTIDNMRTDVMKECRPFYLACERAVIKSSHRPVETFKSERLG